MESCPKMPMIFFDAKISADGGNVFANVLKQLIHVSTTVNATFIELGYIKR